MDLKKRSPTSLDRKRGLELKDFIDLEKLFLISIRSTLLNLKSLVDKRLERIEEEKHGTEDSDFIFENGEAKEAETFEGEL